MFFRALIFVGPRGRSLNMRPLGGVFKHLPRDPAANVKCTETNICDCYSCILCDSMKSPVENA